MKIIYINKSLVEIEQTIEIRGFEIKKLKSVMKIVKIKTKKVKQVKNKLTQIIVGK